MKLVFLLGVLSLLALSITATPDMSLTSLDRGVRQASNEAWGRLRSRSKKGKKERKGKKGKARKGKKGMKAAKGVNGKQRKEDTRKKSTKGNELKQGKGNRREKSKKGNENKGNKKQKFKTRKNEKNERTDPTPGCSDFYDNLRKFRYDQNQLKKVIRINRSITKLRKKVEKAATAFMDGAEFFKDCDLPEGQRIYNALRECNETVPDFCSPDIFLEENLPLLPLYEALDSCESNLTTSTEEGNECIDFCPDDFDFECSYAPVGSPDCNFNELETKLKKFSQICFEGNVQGTYSYCTSLLKDSWETAMVCQNATCTECPEGSTNPITTTTTTTIAPTSIFVPPCVDDSCVNEGFSCFNDNNITAGILNLTDPSDCGRECQNNQPGCVWWTMFNPGNGEETRCFLLDSCVASVDPLAFTGYRDCPPEDEERLSLVPCESCVNKGLSCFDNNNITAGIPNLADPSDCGRECQNNQPGCVWWTMFNPGNGEETRCFLLDSCVASVDPLAFTGYRDCPP